VQAVFRDLSLRYQLEGHCRFVGSCRHKPHIVRRVPERRAVDLKTEYVAPEGGEALGIGAVELYSP
jgi:hypothetical protein